MNMQWWLAVLPVAVLTMAIGAACGGQSGDTAAAQVEAAPTAVSHADLEATLIAKEQEKWDRVAAGDLEGVAGLYADDFINLGFTPTGMVRQTLDESMAMLAQMPLPEGPPAQLSDFKVVRGTDDSAVVTYIVTAPWGTLYVSSVWALRDGEWKTVFYQASPASPPPAASGEAGQVEPAAAAISRTELESTLIAKEHEKWDRFAAGDLEGMAALYADDFINLAFTGTGMVRQTLAESMAALAQMPPPAGPPPQLSDFKVVRGTDDSAVVTYIVTAPWGTDYVSSVWALRDGEWKTVFYQDSPGARPPAPEIAPDVVPVASPTTGLLVTVANGTCRVDGEIPVLPGEVEVTMTAMDSSQTGYSAAFTTLVGDKTIDDLTQATEGANFGRPRWANDVFLAVVGPNDTQTFTMEVEDGPLYVICAGWNGDDAPRYRIGDVVGPIEVAPSAAAAPTPTSGLLVTIGDGTCRVDGTMPVPKGEVEVTLNVTDDKQSDYSAAFTTLVGDKTIDDVRQSSEGPDFARPDWATSVSLATAGPNSTKTYTMQVNGGPLYLICAGWTGSGARYRIGDVVGPIEVAGG